MEREIKFRAWDNEEKKYYEPVHAAYKGDLHELMVSLNGRLSAHTLNSKRGSLMIDESMFPDRYILEQYTGLKDKNGKDIYEGDVVDIGQTVNGCNLFSIEWDRFRWTGRYHKKMVRPRVYEYDLEEFFDLKDYGMTLDSEIEVYDNIHSGDNDES